MKAFEVLVDLEIPMVRFINAIDTSATIRKENAKMGNGNLIVPNPYFSVDTEIGDNCGVFSGAYVCMILCCTGFAT